MPRLTRSQVVHGALGAFAALLVVRAAQVQLWEGRDWAARAHKQHYGAREIPAPRGTLLDARGIPLAQSRELVKLSIAPHEVRDRRVLGKALRTLGVPAAWVARATDARRKWVVLPGRYLPVDAATVTAMRGVYTEIAIDRVYAHGEAMRRVVGRVGADDQPIDGLELALDSLLRGQEGTLLVARDARGRRASSREERGRAPVRGHEVVLTLSRELQDIAERALRDAVERMGAAGGDVVILDPHTGELRALASHRTDGSFSGVPALSAPFEPGSTLKPFFAAALLATGRARPDERIDTENGVYTLEGRTITDVHAEESMTLTDVIRYSSNIGIARFTQRFSKRELYETLRDFGFGAPTGIAYPSETGGRLKEPREWSCPSQSSMATGYEISVTAVQLAAAYAAIANDGLLLVPTLVKEIRDADGEAVYEHRPQVVRRVMQPKTARSLREVLASVVDSGTATDASLATFDLGGKSGTARRVANGRYVQGSYTSTFVGLFPARQPQYVVLVKLDNPQGAYYGGKTAAPVAKAVLQAAIAARDASLDRGGLASQRARYVPPGSELDRPRGRVVATGRVGSDEPEPAPRYALVDSTPVPPATRVTFDLRADTVKAQPREHVAVPDVRGLPVRVAARELHRAGLRVSFVSGAAFEVSPPPGSMVAGGTLVRVARR